MPKATDFHKFCAELAHQVGIGRAGLRRDWSGLKRLVEESVLPRLTNEQVRELLGKDTSRLEGEFNDLKAIATYGVGRGWVEAPDLRAALEAADQSNPLWFLANVSGKTFGGSVAPKLAQYWLCEEGDRWIRQKDVEYYDYDWDVAALGRTIRLELKASSEESPRFQQVRSPRMSGTGKGYDYDGCLCLGGYGGTLEWWYFPAKAVEQFIETEDFTRQHGGSKMVSRTYWVTMNDKNRAKFERFRVSSEHLRGFILKNYA